MVVDRTIAFWQSVHKGDIVQILRRDVANTYGGICAVPVSAYWEFVITSVFEITSKNIDWRVYCLGEQGSHWWLIARVIDNIVSLYMYYETEEIEAGERQNIIDGGNQWLFEEPSNVDNFDVASLEFARQFECMDENGNLQTYKIDESGEIYGVIVDISGDLTDLTSEFVSIAPYSTDADCENTEALIIETGGMDVQGNQVCKFTGGFLRFLQGGALNIHDIIIRPQNS